MSRHIFELKYLRIKNVEDSYIFLANERESSVLVGIADQPFTKLTKKRTLPSENQIE